MELGQRPLDDRVCAADRAASKLGGRAHRVDKRRVVLDPPLRRCSRRTCTVHQERPGDFELRRRVARGHQAEVPDLHEAVRQHVLSKPAEEGIRREGDGLAVLRPEGDTALIHRHEARIRDPDTVGVPAEISNHLLGAAERALGVDVPAHAVEPSAEVVPCLGIGRLASGHLDFTTRDGGVERSEELAAEERPMTSTGNR